MTKWKNFEYIAAVAVVVLGALFLFSGGKETKNSTDLGAAPAAAGAALSSSSNNPAVPKGSVEYNNQRYGFRFLVPAQVAVKEFDEGDGAMTVTVEDSGGEKGFQIFIVPYNGATISEERFKEDVPSGVMNEPTSMVIGGVDAVQFYSENDELGQTKEIWFIRGGFLYEVMTYRSLEEWLSGIMKTWSFETAN